MRNVPNKSCRENQNTHFPFSNFFSKNRTVFEIISKKWWNQKSLRGQYGSTLHAGLVGLHVHKHMPPTHMQSCAHSHRNVLVLLLFHGSSGFANTPKCHTYITSLVHMNMLIS
jgi:hypothetical protein